MIEINLVPPEQRKKRKKLLMGGLKIPMEVIVGSAGGLLILLVFFHIGLLFLNISKIGEHKRLKAKWEKIAPDKKQADDVLGELRTVQAKYSAIKDIVGESRQLWSQKLNIVSDVIPRGVWIKKVALTENVFYLDGSAVSKSADQMTSVHGFISNLKGDKAFASGFTGGIELGNIQRRVVKNVEVADFIISANLHAEKAEPE